jgi:cobalamin-dependent methionine synthase I
MVNFEIMMCKTFQYDFKDLKLTVNQIERFMGYKSGESQEMVSDLISDLLKEAENICDIRAEYKIFETVRFDNDARSVNIGDLVFDIRKIVYGQLKKADSIAVFLCTAGEEIGIRSRKAMKEGDLLKGYAYDVIGSEAVETTADIMQNDLEKKLSGSGLKITNRFSPGYCGWDVAEQHKIFSLFPNNFCGIRLTPSALMDPVKSISGFIGIGENVKRLPYTCSLCDMKDCIYRKGRVK